nr:ribonuclease H-like domain-containing protein [Tanacetum cinerariifolium]
MVNGTNHSRVNHSANTVPKAVLTKTGLKPVNTIRPVNPKSTRRSFQRRTAYNNRNFSQKVNTDKGKFNTARPNSAVLNVVRANKGKSVKASAWSFTQAVRRPRIFDCRCSRHMKGNISYLTDFKEFDGGYVAFEVGSKGGKITGNGIIKTATKDETSRILKRFITEIENLVDNKNKVLVVKPYFKTPYELFRGRTPALSFMRPFGCHVTILNTLNHLGMFIGKSDEGFFVGYSTNSKAFRVYNTRIRKVEENLLINFLENKPILAGDGPKWLFDIDALMESMKYVPVIADTNSNDFVRKGVSFDADSDGDNKDNNGPCKESEIDNQERPNAENSTKDVNTVGLSINTVSSNISTASSTVNTVRLSYDFFSADNDMRSLDGVKVDISNISTIYPVSTTPNIRIHKDHSLDNVIGDMQFGVQTRRITIITDEQGLISAIYEENTHEDLHTYLFALKLDANHRELSPPCILYQDSQGLQTLDVDTHKPLL